MDNNPNKPQNTMAPMPNELLIALSANMRPTPEDIQKLSQTYNYPAEKIQNFVSFCQKNPLPPVRPVVMAPRVNIIPQNTAYQPVQIPLIKKQIVKPEELPKEKKEKKVIEEKKKPVQEEMKKPVEEKKKKTTDEFSIPKIPKKKDKSDVERRIESLMGEDGSLKIEFSKKFIEVMERTEDDNSRLFIIKTLSKHSKFGFSKKFIQSNGLILLKNWLNNSPSKQLVHDILQLPITLDDLKSSEIGKTVKKFNKVDDSINNFYSSEIKEVLKKLMDKWKIIIKNEKVPSISSPTTESAPGEKDTKKGIFSSITSSKKEEKKKEVLTSSPEKVENVEMSEAGENKKKRKLVQKKVTWAPQLCHIKLYEVEVMQSVPTQNSYQNEHLLEKKMFEQKREEHLKRLENMKETTSWASLIPLKLDKMFVKGSDSEEKLVQENRRLMETMIQYQNDFEIPETPSSPQSSLSSSGDENILQTLTQDPNLLTQLLGMLKQPTTSTTTTSGPTQSTNPYSTLQNSYSNYSSYNTNSQNVPSYQIPTTNQNQNPYSSLSSFFSSSNSWNSNSYGSSNYTNDYSQMLKQNSGQQQQDEMNDPTTQQRCKFYNTPAGCKKGANCQYLHSRDDYRI